MQPAFELYRLDRELDRASLIDELAAVPARLRAAIAAADPATLAGSGSGDEWSPMQVIRHLRDAVQVYGMRFKWMILDDEPLLPNYDENRWAADSPDGPADIESVLAAIEAYRAETVRLLRALPPAGWQRRGNHEALGWLELGPYVRHELAHEEQHLAQLQHALGA